MPSLMRPKTKRIECYDFETDPDRYAQFTNAMAALTARVTVLLKQYQWEAREQAVEQQERSKADGELSSHPDRVFKIIQSVAVAYCLHKHSVSSL